MKLSLRARLSLLWLVIVVICTALGVIMHRVYSLGVEAQTARMRDMMQDACETIQRQYTLSTRHQGGSGALDSALAYAVLQAVLRDTPGVEGGIWREHETLEAQFVAYAFPTHAGSEVKKDVPQTERTRLAALARQSLAQRAPLSDSHSFSREAVLTHAQPMLDLSPPLVVWTMARIPLATGAAYDQLRVGLGVLFFFSLASGGVFAIFLMRWSQRFAQLTTALATHSQAHMPDIALTGDVVMGRIVSVVNDVSARLNQAQAAGVQIATEVAVDEWRFDPLHLGRAVENLLSNALQHTPHGGGVHIAVHSHGAYVLLRVSDTGRGVAPEVLPRLFEPFVTNRATGTGLGLALVREIVGAHGGSVQLSTRT